MQYLSFPASAAIAAATLALAACQPAYLEGTGEPVGNERTVQGGILGAATGAALGGIISGGDASGAAIGAAIGGIAGAGIGSGLDRQAAELRRDLGDQVTVSNEGDYLLVSFPQDILFATNSATVASSQRNDLNALAANLQRYPDTRVAVIGHTDNTGSAAFNFDLSARRAGAVASILVEAGVPGSRIEASGRGEDQPVASNLTPEGRAQNRRVEVIIRPNAA